MLLAAILLTLFGFIIMQWSIKANKQMDKAPIFFNPFAVIIIYILWIGLIISGLYCFWQVNHLFVFIIAVIYFLFVITRNYLRSDTRKAIKICKIYKQIKLLQPLTNEQDVLKSTARKYFENIRWEKFDIDRTLDIMFNKFNRYQEKNIKELIFNILIFDDPYPGFSLKYDFKKDDKREKAIEKAFNAILRE